MADLSNPRRALLRAGFFILSTIASTPEGPALNLLVECVAEDTLN
jgi:hypothetical protein